MDVASFLSECNFVFGFAAVSEDRWLCGKFVWVIYVWFLYGFMLVYM